MTGLIAHIDMDAFFAAVEVRANPRLVGKPLLVGGGPSGREVVTTASYPARFHGIHSGMSLREARSRCPQAIYIPVNPALYLHTSESLIRIFERFTPAVEPASIDEAFLDLAGVAGVEDGGVRLCRTIQETVLQEESLTCSVGIASSKLAAKMATGLMKPAGMTRLGPGDFERHFWPRPTSDLWGVGPESSSALRQVGVNTIGQLAAARVDLLTPLFGAAARVLIRMANGEGGGPVVSGTDRTPVRSMGHETTFPRDLSDPVRIRRYLLLLSDKVSRRLRLEGWAGHQVTIRLRWSDGTTISRQKSLTSPTDDGGVIYRAAHRLLLANRTERSIRLLGVNVGQLIHPGTHYALFDEEHRANQFSRVRDRLRDRFGESSIMPGGVVALFGRLDRKES